MLTSADIVRKALRNSADLATAQKAVYQRTGRLIQDYFEVAGQRKAVTG
jgi:hypothetical protein